MSKSNTEWKVDERGFITSPYIEGLKPQDMFCEYNSAHTNTAISHLDVRTSGYNTRKMMSAMLDLITTHKRTIEDCGRIVIFYAPLFNPEYGSNPIDIEKLCTSAWVDPNATIKKVLSDEDIIKGFKNLLENDTIATTFLRACASQSPESRTILYYKIRKILVSRFLQAGFPIGSVAAADINSSVTQSTLDAFHSTSSDTTSAAGAKSILEQRKYGYSTNDNKDSFSKAKIPGAHITVTIDEGVKATILKAVQPEKLAVVVETMEIVYHPWLTAMSTPPNDEKSQELSKMMKQSDMLAQVYGESSMTGIPFFATTMRIVAKPGLCLKDIYMLKNALNSYCCSKKSKPQFTLFWTIGKGMQAIFRVCIKHNVVKNARKAPQPSKNIPTKRCKLDEVEESEEESDDESDDMEDSDDESVSDEADEEEEKEEESDDDIDDDKDVESTPSESDDDEEEDEDEEDEEDDEEKEKKEKPKGKGRVNIVTNELQAYEIMHTYVSGKKYLKKANNYIKTKNIKSKKCQHNFLDKHVWKGLPIPMDSNVHFEDSKLVIPECRIEILLNKYNRHMLLNSIESTHHGNNICMFGVEAATKIMRKNLKKMWPNMPYFYIFLLVEHGSFSGRILSVNHAGIISSKGSLDKLCFEKSVDYLLSNEKVKIDHLNSHVSRTIFGMPIKAGTNVTELCVDAKSFLHM
jgi:hypothetical protein